MPFLPYWVGTIDPWALRFLVVREIDGGGWLALGYMPAQQQCDLFYPPGWGSYWVYHKLGNAPVLRFGTGSWVLSGWLVVCHPLSPVIRLGLRNPNQKKKKAHYCTSICLRSWCTRRASCVDLINKNKKKCQSWLVRRRCSIVVRRKCSIAREETPVPYIDSPISV